MIFFSAHGVPVSYVEDAGDPYKDQMEECIYLIMQELKARGFDNDHTLAYQVAFSILFHKLASSFVLYLVRKAILGSCLFYLSILFSYFPITRLWLLLCFIAQILQCDFL